MTKDELRKELKTGVKLEDIFKFTEGQDTAGADDKFWYSECAVQKWAPAVADRGTEEG